MNTAWYIILSDYNVLFVHFHFHLICVRLTCPCPCCKVELYNSIGHPSELYCFSLCFQKKCLLELLELLLNIADFTSSNTSMQ